jgi:hypothetical protein
MKPICSAPLAICAFIACGQVHAQGLGAPVDKRFLVAAQAAMKLPPAIEVVGEGAIAPMTVARAGNSEPLSAALKTIVPADYQVLLGAGVVESVRTSWPAGVTWTAALGTALRGVSLRAVVAHDAREVAVTIAPRVDDTAKRPWTVLVGDGTVRRALARWTSSAGLTLSWEPSGPVPVRADWTHSGTLDEALAALGKDLATGEQPLCLRRYANGVVRVTLPESCPVEPTTRPVLRPTAPAASSTRDPHADPKPLTNPSYSAGGA